MHVQTNTLRKYIDVFGDKTLIEAIGYGKTKEVKNSFLVITNPILRFLVHTTYEKADRLFSYKKPMVPANDYSQFRLVAALLSDLKEEIHSNPSYKSQLAGKLFSHQAGPMTSALNEILVAGFYKSIGKEVELNSSAQSGKADIDVLDSPFATDAKTFGNNRLRLEAMVNESASQVLKSVRLVRNQGLLIHVFNPDKKLFHRSMSGLAEAFKDLNCGRYADENIAADIMDNSYAAADFTIRLEQIDVNVFFQASWDFGPLIDELKTSLIKAESQAKALNKQAIPWVMVPRDAKRQAIEINVLRFAGELHGFVMERPDIFAIPVYSIEFDGKKVNISFDIFEVGQNTLNINAGSFQKYVADLMSRPELYIT